MENVRVAVFPGNFARAGAQRQAFLLAERLSKLGHTVTAISLLPKGLSGDLPTEFPALAVNYLTSVSLWLPLKLLARARGIRTSLQPQDNNYFFDAGRGTESASSFWAGALVRLILGKPCASLQPSSVRAFRLRPVSALEALLLARFLRRWQCDLLISYTPWPNMLSVIAGRLTGTAVVVSERNDIEKQAAPPMVSWARANLYVDADIVTANTETATNRIARNLPDEKVAWQPNDYSYLPRLEPFSGLRRKMVVVGRLVSQKRIDTAIRAVKILHDRGLMMDLNIYGEGPYESKLRKLAFALGVDERVNFLGYRTDLYPLLLLDKGGIFVLASSYEGSANALHEAVATGYIPVIADTVSEVSHLLRPSLLERLIFDGSPEALAKTVEYLVTNPIESERVRSQVLADFFEYWDRGERNLKKFCKRILNLPTV